MACILEKQDCWGLVTCSKSGGLCGEQFLARHCNAKDSISHPSRKRCLGLIRRSQFTLQELALRMGEEKTC